MDWEPSFVDPMPAFVSPAVPGFSAPAPVSAPVAAFVPPAPVSAPAPTAWASVRSVSSNHTVFLCGWTMLIYIPM
jgi:hypothetical protein